MSVLTVCQQVALAVGIARPLAVFSETTREMQELQAVVNEAAEVVVDSFDWQALLKARTITGNAVAEAFDMPTDYRRMMMVGGLWMSRTREPATAITLDDWLALDVQPSLPIQGVWSLFGGQIHIRPILKVGETAKFFYVRDDFVSGGKTAFSSDADTFVLDERLLKLAAIYLWKQGKGQDFTAELSDFEMAMDRAKRFDAGAMQTLSGNLPARRATSNVWPGKVSG